MHCLFGPLGSGLDCCLLLQYRTEMMSCSHYAYYLVLRVDCKLGWLWMSQHIYLLYLLISKRWARIQTSWSPIWETKLSSQRELGVKTYFYFSLKLAANLHFIRYVFFIRFAFHSQSWFHLIDWGSFWYASRKTFAQGIRKFGNSSVSRWRGRKRVESCWLRPPTIGIVIVV